VYDRLIPLVAFHSVFIHLVVCSAWLKVYSTNSSRAPFYLFSWEGPRVLSCRKREIDEDGSQNCTTVYIQCVLIEDEIRNIFLKERSQGFIMEFILDIVLFDDSHHNTIKTYLRVSLCLSSIFGPRKMWVPAQFDNQVTKLFTINLNKYFKWMNYLFFTWDFYPRQNLRPNRSLSLENT